MQLARLRATGAVLSRALFGRKSEKQETPRSGRPRGQQRGAPGHGRTQRPGLEERTEELKPPEEARVCSCCGKAYVANGVDESTLVEIEVKAHKRVIRRPRWRRACGCASSPIEVSAPPAPRLFPRTLYGTSFWARFLFEHCACFRPLHRVAAWISGQGLPISPGTLANSLKRFVPLFEPVADAILAHQNEAALRHAAETGWRVQALRAKTLAKAEANLEAVDAAPTSEDPAECVADKGYHSRAVLRALNDSPWKTRIAAPKQTGFSRWHGDEAARRAVTNNRARLKSGVAREAFKLRAEIVERCFAHNLDRGGMRRTWLRGRENVHKRYLLHVAGHNLSLLMRQLIGAGTPGPVPLRESDYRRPQDASR